MRLAERRVENRRQRTIAVDIERRLLPLGSDRRMGDRRSRVKLLRRLAGLHEADRGGDRVFFVERLEPVVGREDDHTARLVRRILKGERELYGDVYARYFNRIYAYLRQALRDPVEAEDVTQQTFVQALEALPRFDSARAPFRAWLFAISRNLALNSLAGKKRVELVDPSELAQRQTADAERVDATSGWLLERDLVREVERLPALQREVLVLRTVLDLPFETIAKRLDRRRDNVRALHSRAMRSLNSRMRATHR